MLSCKLQLLKMAERNSDRWRLYLGPQFLLFMLTFREIGSKMPKLLLGTNSVLFEDVLGRRKYLPVELFQNFTVFNTFLRESFIGVPGQEYVNGRRYQLTNAENTVVDHSDWQKTVLRRSKIAMFILLERIVEDEVVCPRCWMPESSKKVSVSVQCSSCGLIYKTEVPAGIQTSKEIQNTSTIMEPLSSSTKAVPLPQETPTEDSFRSLDEWGEVEFTSGPIGSRKSETARPLESGDRRRVKDISLSWSHQDLIHFKRVQVLGSQDQVRQPQYLPLFRLLMIFSRVRDLASSAVSTLDPELSVTKQSLETIIRDTFNCAEMIHSCFSYHVFELLYPENNRDWKVTKWSKAWSASLHLSQRSRDLFSVVRRMCQELKDCHNIRFADSTLVFWDKAIAQLETSVLLLKDVFGILSGIENDWGSSNTRLRQTVSSRNQRSNQKLGENEEIDESSDVPEAATCLAVTARFIIVALDSGLISIFDHHLNPLVKTLEWHPMGVWALATHDTHDFLASGGSDRSLKI